MAASSSELFVEPRFCGPPGTANGGFACGAIAARWGGAADVTLRRPIPLGRPLDVLDAGDGTLAVLDGDRRLAQAAPLGTDLGKALTVPAVPAELAAAAAGVGRYFADPAFPGCFVCGPGRAPGDGLRIFPGPVPGGSVWAAPWTPDASVAGADGKVRPEVVWAALDCPTGIAAGEAAELPGDTTALLGRMSAQVTESPRPGARCRVVAWPIAREGRSLTAGGALLGPEGTVLAMARAVWITVPHPAHRLAAGATS
jgi:hypothetical protein